MAGEVTRRRIQLQEYGKERTLKAGQIDLRALSEANKRWSRALGLASDPIRISIRENGTIDLRAEAVTGIVHVGDTDIEIAPKFLNADDKKWQSVLWRILSEVEGGYIDESLTSAAETSSLSVPDLLAEMFLASYSKGAARGLPRGYRTVEGSGTVLRGSLDVSRLDRWVARPWAIPYVADILAEDTVLARLLRWTAQCLAEVVSSPARARALFEVAGGLGHVGTQPPHLIDAQRTVLGAQHRGLEAARIVGLLLLEGAGVHHTLGAHSVSGFLWNSDTIYENYVYRLCGLAAARRGERVTKVRTRFGTILSGSGSSLETTPDVVFRNSNGIVTAVADAKYKRFGTRPKAADAYQVITAAHVLGCQRVSLTYPVDQHREATVWRISSGLGSADIELTALPLNLMALASPSGQRALIDTIGEWLDRTVLSVEHS